MPTYAFRCPDCTTTFDERRSFARSDDPTTCPSCGAQSATKVLGTPMVFRKGVAARALLESPGTPALARPTADHGSGCPCCSGRRPAIATPARTIPDPS